MILDKNHAIRTTQISSHSHGARSKVRVTRIFKALSIYTQITPPDVVVCDWSRFIIIRIIATLLSFVETLGLSRNLEALDLTFLVNHEEMIDQNKYDKEH